MLEVCRYVMLNPVRAKIVEDRRGYRWSSYNAYAYGKKDLLTDEYPIDKRLSNSETERPKKYRNFVKELIKNRKGMRGKMDRRIVYGNEDFIKEPEKKYN